MYFFCYSNPLNFTGKMGPHTLFLEGLRFCFLHCEVLVCGTDVSAALSYSKEMGQLGK